MITPKSKFAESTQPRNVRLFLSPPGELQPLKSIRTRQASLADSDTVAKRTGDDVDGYGQSEEEEVPAAVPEQGKALLTGEDRINIIWEHLAQFVNKDRAARNLEKRKRFRQTRSQISCCEPRRRKHRRPRQYFIRSEALAANEGLRRCASLESFISFQLPDSDQCRAPRRTLHVTPPPAAQKSNRPTIRVSSRSRIRKQVKAPIPLFPHKPQSSFGKQRQKPSTPGNLVDAVSLYKEAEKVLLKAEYYSRLKVRDALKQLKNSFRYEQPATFDVDCYTVLDYEWPSCRIHINKTDYMMQPDSTLLQPWYSTGFAILTQHSFIQERKDLSRQIALVRTAYPVESYYSADSSDDDAELLEKARLAARSEVKNIRGGWYDPLSPPKKKEHAVLALDATVKLENVDTVPDPRRPSRNYRKKLSRSAGHRSQQLFGVYKEPREFSIEEVSDQEDELVFSPRVEGQNGNGQGAVDPYVSAYPALRPHTFAMKEIVKEIINGKDLLKKIEQQKNRPMGDFEMLALQAERKVTYATKVSGGLRPEVKINYRNMTLMLKENQLKFALHGRLRDGGEKWWKVDETDIARAEERVVMRPVDTEKEIADLAGTSPEMTKNDFSWLRGAAGKTMEPRVDEEFLAECNGKMDSFAEFVKQQSYNAFFDELELRNLCWDEVEAEFSLSLPANLAHIVNNERIRTPFIFEGMKASTARQKPRKANADPPDDDNGGGESDSDGADDSSSDGSEEGDHSKMTSMLFDPGAKEMAKLLIRRAQGNHKYKSVLKKIACESGDGSGSDEEPDIMKTGRSGILLNQPLPIILDSMDMIQQEDESEDTARVRMSVHNASVAKILLPNQSLGAGSQDNGKSDSSSDSDSDSNSSSPVYPKIVEPSPCSSFKRAADLLVVSKPGMGGATSKFAPIPRGSSQFLARQDGDDNPRIVVLAVPGEQGLMPGKIKRRHLARQDTDIKMLAEIMNADTEREQKQQVPEKLVTPSVRSMRKKLTIEDDRPRVKRKKLRLVRRPKHSADQKDADLPVDMSKQLFWAVRKMSNTEVRHPLTPKIGGRDPVGVPELEAEHAEFERGNHAPRGSEGGLCADSGDAAQVWGRCQHSGCIISEMRRKQNRDTGTRRHTMRGVWDITRYSTCCWPSARPRGWPIWPGRTSGRAHTMRGFRMQTRRMILARTKLFMSMRPSMLVQN